MFLQTTYNLYMTNGLVFVMQNTPDTDNEKLIETAYRKTVLHE